MTVKPKFRVHGEIAWLAGVLMGLVLVLWWLFVPTWQHWVHIPPGYALLIIVLWPLLLWKRFERRTLAAIYGATLAVAVAALWTVAALQRTPQGDYLDDCRRDEIRLVYHDQMATINLDSGKMTRQEYGRALQPLYPQANWENLKEARELLDRLPPPSRKFPWTNPYSSGHFSIAFYRYGFLHVYHYADNEAVEQKRKLMQVWAR